MIAVRKDFAMGGGVEGVVVVSSFSRWGGSLVGRLVVVVVVPWILGGSRCLAFHLLAAEPGVELGQAPTLVIGFLLTQLAGEQSNACSYC